MKRMSWLIALLFSTVTLTACSQSSSNGMTQAIFIEQEQGIDPYPVRMLVNKDFLRIDDSDATDGFVLYDRKEKTIYSITTEDNRALKIDDKPITVKRPNDLSLSIQSKPNADVPSIAGQQPTQYDYLIKDQTCQHVMAVPELLDDLRQALIEYRQVLASEQAANLDKTPQSFLSECFLSNDIFHVEQRFEHGFPVAIWMDYKGSNQYRRILQSYETIDADTQELFSLPDGIQVYTLNP